MAESAFPGDYDRKPRNIALLGPIPPPLGGVSTHVLREAALLGRQGHAVSLLRYTGLTQADRLGRVAQAARQWLRATARLSLGRHDVVHVHYATSAALISLLPQLASTRGRLVITLHAVRVLDDLDRLRPPARRLLCRALQRADQWICVRQEIADGLAQRGVSGVPVCIKPAFLPPAPEEADAARLPAAVRQALAADEAAARPIASAAAYYLGPGYGQEDLYGVEHLVASLAVAESRLERPWSLHVLVSNRPGDAPQNAALQRVERMAAGLKRARTTVHFGAPLVPVLAASRAFVRPSRQDGDSVAVREAQALGVPVLASDLVPRPAGVRLFRLASPHDTASTLVDFLNAAAAGRPEAQGAISGDEGVFLGAVLGPVPPSGAHP